MISVGKWHEIKYYVTVDSGDFRIVKNREFYVFGIILSIKKYVGHVKRLKTGRFFFDRSKVVGI